MSGNLQSSYFSDIINPNWLAYLSVRKHTSEWIM
jgi:hypothetical protein